MTKNKRKGIYIFGSILVVGAITAAIVLPITLSGAFIDNNLRWDGDDDFVSGGVEDESGNDWLDDIGDIGKKDETILNKVQYQSSFFMYEREQTGSIDYQRMHFEWEIIDNVKKIKAEKEEGNDPEIIQEYEDEIRDIEKKIEVIDDDKVDYNSSKFSSEYSEILLPIDKVRERQDKIFRDYKESFIRKFATREEGLSQWPEERLSRYNNATNDNDALDYLVNNQITSDASGLFKFTINDSFTFEQKNSVFPIKYFEFKEAGTEDDNIDHWFEGQTGADEVFPFLANANEKTGSADEEKVYLLASQSKIPNRIAVDEGTDPIVDEVVNSELLIVEHALIGAKQNNTGHLLPWTIDKDTLINKLYTFFGASSQRSYNLVSNLFNYTSSSDPNYDSTSTFIRNFSNNSEGTKHIQGSLGVKPAVEFVTSMVDGFGLGIMSIYQNMKGLPGAVAPTNPNIFADLQQALIDSEELITGAGNGPLINQDHLEQLVNAMTEEEVTNKFGKMFSDLFTTNGSLDMVYGEVNATSGRNIVVSEEHGIHAVKVEQMDKAGLIQRITEDLVAVAEAQNINKSKTSFSSLFTNHFDQTNQIKFIIDHYNDNDEFSDYIAENEEDIVFNDIIKLIASRRSSVATTKAKAATESKVEWYIEAIKSQLRNLAPLNPEQIYQIAYQMAEGTV